MEQGRLEMKAERAQMAIGGSIIYLVWIKSAYGMKLDGEGWWEKASDGLTKEVVERCWPEKNLKWVSSPYGGVEGLEQP